MKLMALSKESDPNAVTLATLHSSKGLEFENVYIIDANEGIMPYKKAVLEKDIEEERRLFLCRHDPCQDKLVCLLGQVGKR